MCAIERWPEIGTDRLMLRAPVIADAPLVAELANDPVIARNTSRLPHPYGLADAEAWLGAIASQDPHRNRSFAVEDRRLGLIGVLGFDERRPRQTEVGYWFGRRSGGVATRLRRLPAPCAGPRPPGAAARSGPAISTTTTPRARF